MLELLEMFIFVFLEQFPWTQSVWGAILLCPVPGKTAGDGGKHQLIWPQPFFFEKSHNSLWSKLVMVLVLVHFIKKMRKLPVIFLALFKIFIKMSYNLFNMLQKRFLRRHKWVFYSFSRWFLFIAAFTLKVTFNGLKWVE